MKLFVIVGPTAVGKTDLSIQLAKSLNGEIINGDAMQIYKGLDIGTAKITPTEMEGVVHHLLDEKMPDERYSVFEYQQKVRGKIAEIWARGKVAIVVGGTGLYIKAALYDYEFSEAPRKPSHAMDNLSNEALHAKLRRLDDVAASQIHPNNRRRILRAIEIFETTKQTKTATNEAQAHKLIMDACMIGLRDERQALYGRINARVDRLVAVGLIDEVRRLYDSGVPRDAQSIAAIGYKELYAHFDGEIDLETAIMRIKTNSRRLAKRQYTWFNNQMDVTWFDVNVAQFDQTVAQVLDFCKQL